MIPEYVYFLIASAPRANLVPIKEGHSAKKKLKLDMKISTRNVHFHTRRGLELDPTFGTWDFYARPELPGAFISLRQVGLDFFENRSRQRMPQGTFLAQNDIQSRLICIKYLLFPELVGCLSFVDSRFYPVCSHDLGEDWSG